MGLAYELCEWNKKITKKLQTRITVTLDHTPDRPKDRTPHVGTYTHTLALLGCDHVPKWGVRSFGRSGVWSSVTVILVCNFLVIFLNAIFFFNIIFFSNFLKAGRGLRPPPPLTPLLFYYVCLCVCVAVSAVGMLEEVGWWSR